jgi:hypothetical protein
MPSQSDIDKVKVNLNNLIAFNQDLLTNSEFKLINAYSLLSQTDNKDLGLTIGLNILSTCFSKLADLLGPPGEVFSSFMSAMVGNYSKNTPPSLGDLFSNLLTRIQKTILQTNQDLSNYYVDPVSNWDKVITGSFKSPFGTFTKSGKLSDLASSDFPNKDHPKYYDILNNCLKGMDQTIWATLLPRFVITDYQEDVPPMWNLPCNPDDEDNEFLPHNKSYYNTWEYHEDKDCYGNLVKYYHREQYNLGTGAGTFSDGALNDNACNYLFQNYATAEANKDGLFKRDFVFKNLGIPTATQYIHNGGRMKVKGLPKYTSEYYCCCLRRKIQNLKNN